MKHLEELGENGWTGGQYSALRFSFGALIGSYFLRLFSLLLFQRIPVSEVEPGLTLNIYSFAGSTILFLVFTAVGFVFSVLIAIGYRDRQVGVVAAYLLICSIRRFTVQSVSVLDFSAWLLLLHYLTPPAPYGSVAALGRGDPDGGWKLPWYIRSIAWCFLSFLYFGIGLVTVLQLSLFQLPAADHDFLLITGIVELIFPLTILLKRLRIPFWFLLLILTPIQMLLMVQIGAMFSLVFVHLFVFDPRWIKPLAKPGRAAESPGDELVFYDGECGLCHMFVRFVLAEDRQQIFRFAPLQSGRFAAEIASRKLTEIPDSVVVLQGDGELTFRSAGIVYVLKRLGGFWRIGGSIIGSFPRPLRDWGYDRIAAVRKKLFEKPVQVCPVVDSSIMRRFEA